MTATSEARTGGPGGTPGRRPLIGVDFHAFDGLYQGSRSRLLGIFSLLPAIAEELDFVFYCGEPDRLRAALPPFDPQRVRFERLRSKGPFGRLLLELPRLAKKHGVDVFHSQYILPVGLNCARVVTVHDILFESHPQYFGRGFIQRSRIFTRRSARAADHVLTVSEYSAEEIRQRYGVARERITVSHNAVDPVRFSPAAADASKLRARGLAEGEYILSVGRIDERKNYGALIEAYARLDCTQPLVIVGQAAGPDSERVLHWRSPKGTGRVIHLDDVDDEELPSLYAGASVFAFLSHAEGFGMPLIEAMASGTPVISSDCTSMPEVAGDAACLVNPGDVDAIHRALETMISDAGQRATLTSRGLERIKAFSWRKEAKQLRGIYNQVLAGAAAR